MRKKLIVFITICLAGFAGQASPNSNQLTFILQAPIYQKTQEDLLYSVAAALAGFMAGPFLFIPLASIVGRSSVILWSLVATMICQIWAAEMTAVNDYIPFVLSRLTCGLFGVLPAILGSGYIMDMFFLHQRGKAFAVFEITIIFAVIGSGTFGGFIAETRPWTYVFWWTVGPIGAAIILVFCFVEDTSFNRDPNLVGRSPLPKGWLAKRVATFLPGVRTVGPVNLKEIVSPYETLIIYLFPSEKWLIIPRYTRFLHLSSSLLRQLCFLSEHLSSSHWEYPSCRLLYNPSICKHRLQQGDTASRHYRMLFVSIFAASDLMLLFFRRS